MKLKIAIIGTRGIPNQYGGFEQFAEYLSVGLVERGHSVYVYNSHTHPFQQNMWNGVHILHCYDPEPKLGTAGQFIYDLNCIKDAREKKFDVLLFLGYTSSSVWGRWYPENSVIISNMDGLEWKRTKYSKPVQSFLRFAERLAIKHSHYLIADSIGIEFYLKEKYGVAAKYIAYGATPFKNPDMDIPAYYTLKAFSYSMLMARMEPENNIEMILDGFSSSVCDHNFIVIGNTSNKFGSYIKQKFAKETRIKFLGAIYNQNHINNLRYFSNLYFHGHSVGGTNPSLLEAMASNALIAAHNNIFNKSILEENAFYFSDVNEVRKLVEGTCKKNHQNALKINLEKIVNNFSWEKIINEYENYFFECYEKFQTQR